MIGLILLDGMSNPADRASQARTALLRFPAAVPVPEHSVASAKSMLGCSCRTDCRGLRQRRCQLLRPTIADRRRSPVPAAVCRVDHLRIKRMPEPRHILAAPNTLRNRTARLLRPASLPKQGFDTGAHPTMLDALQRRQPRAYNGIRRRTCRSHTAGREGGDIEFMVGAEDQGGIEKRSGLRLVWNPGALQQCAAMPSSTRYVVLVRRQRGHTPQDTRARERHLCRTKIVGRQILRRQQEAEAPDNVPSARHRATKAAWLRQCGGREGSVCEKRGSACFASPGPH